jgi:fructose transport system ATP-binding protein
VDQKGIGLIMAKTPASISAAKADAAADNLLLIKGIGPVNNAKLIAHGIARFAQIAAWKKSDVVSVEKYLEFDGRIAREDWIGQAARLAKASKAKPVQKPVMAKAAAVRAAPAVKVNAGAKPKAAVAVAAKAVAASPKMAKPAPAKAAPKAAAKAKASPVVKAKAAAKPAASAKPKAAVVVAAKTVAATPKVTKSAPPKASAKAKAAPAAKVSSGAKASPKAAPKAAAKAKRAVKAAPVKAAAVPATAAAPKAAEPVQAPILTTRNLTKRYGRVTALDSADFDLYPNEILAVIGDNGAGKSSLIKAISGAVIPDEGEIQIDGKVVHFKSPMEARAAGIETVYQNLALSPALSISDNMFLGREIRQPGFMGKWFRALDRTVMEKRARDKLTELGLMTIQNISQAVETLSGGQRQGVAVARAAAFGSKMVIMDEPTAALGVKESRRVLELILDVKHRGLPIVLISHNMPHVFEVADRIHIHRLGKRLCVINPKEYTMSDAVAFMTGAKEPPRELLAA